MPTTELHKINDRLSEGEKRNLPKRARKTITLRLKRDALIGGDTLLVPASVPRRLERNRVSGHGMDIRLAKTNIRKQVGGGLLSSILPLVKKLAKSLGLAALA